MAAPGGSRRKETGGVEQSVDVSRGEEDIMAYMKLVLLSAMAAGTECFLLTPSLVQGKSLPALRTQRSVRASEVCMNLESQATRREVLALSLASAVAAAIPCESLLSCMRVGSSDRVYPAAKADAAGLAFGYSENLKDMNTQLEAYGLTKVASIPGGFKPLMQAIGGSVRVESWKRRSNAAGGDSSEGHDEIMLAGGCEHRRIQGDGFDRFQGQRRTQGDLKAKRAKSL
eukprot:741327-Hanusia_phi.AAC.5